MNVLSVHIKEHLPVLMLSHVLLHISEKFVSVLPSQVKLHFFAQVSTNLYTY